MSQKAQVVTPVRSVEDFNLRSLAYGKEAFGKLPARAHTSNR